MVEVHCFQGYLSTQANEGADSGVHPAWDGAALTGPTRLGTLEVGEGFRFGESGGLQ